MLSFLLETFIFLIFASIIEKSALFVYGRVDGIRTIINKRI